MMPSLDLLSSQSILVGGTSFKLLLGGDGES